MNNHWTKIKLNKRISLLWSLLRVPFSYSIKCGISIYNIKQTMKKCTWPHYIQINSQTWNRIAFNFYSNPFDNRLGFHFIAAENILEWLYCFHYIMLCLKFLLRWILRSWCCILTSTVVTIWDFLTLKSLRTIFK